MLLLIHVLIRYLISLAKTEQTEVIYIFGIVTNTLHFFTWNIPKALCQLL